MVLEKIFFRRDDTNAPVLHFRFAWPEMISPCIWEDASVVLQIGFLGILLLYIIRNSFSKVRKARDEEKYPTGVGYGLSYKLGIICSSLMLSTHLVTLLLISQTKTGTDQCQSQVILLSSRILQVASWTITLIALYKIRKAKYLKFPWILRFWWTSSFLLSLARAAIDVHCVVLSHSNVGVQEYADLLGFLASVCLICISIRGKTGVNLNILDDDEITNPLLNGKGEKHSGAKRDCPYGRSSLIQLITFSWINELFEVGYRKPLDQDEVPDVDIKDSASFLSQEFEVCLEYAKERDRTETPSIYTVIYILARKKAAINALLALGFLTAKLVETIAQRQWIFGARQLGLRIRAALISRIYKKGLILTWYLNTLWQLPVQISLAVYVLHTNLGMGAIVALAVTFAIMAFRS